MDALKWLQGAVYLVTVVGGLFTIFTYWRSTKLRRAEWLRVLYEKFYEHDHYKRVRHAIDYDVEELHSFRLAIEKDLDHDLAEPFVDYLNFFEFIASLWRLGQLNLTEIRMLFEYYLRRLEDFEFIVGFIREQGFENLLLLLARLRRERTQ